MRVREVKPSILTRPSLRNASATPRPVIERLNAEVVKATTSPEFAAQLEKRGLIPQSFSLAQTREFVGRDAERWGRAVKASGAKIDD